ncbi:MAG: ATP-dependent helicase, partial [Pseudomonadota bacterium]
HAFRPAYEQLGACLDDLRPRHLLALTATAGPAVRADIVRSLRMAGAAVEVAGFDRPNLHLEAHVVRTDAEKLDTVAAALRGRTPAIVYAATRRRVETLAARLTGLGQRTGAYHAGLSPEARAETQDAFLAGRLDVVVATNAFGLGIDKPDVRLVAHVDPPLSVEAWYQEVGRAGRDGAPAAALLLHAREADRRLLHFLLRRASPVVPDVQLVHRALADAGASLSPAVLEGRLTRLKPGRLSACLATLEAIGAAAREGGERFELRVRSDVAAEGESTESRLLRALGGRSGVVDDLRLRELLGCTSRSELGQQLEAAVAQGRLRVRSTSVRNGAWVLARALRTSDLDRIRDRSNRDEERLEQMLQLARSRSCRRRLVLEAFGESAGPSRCQACDRCVRSLFAPVRSRLPGRTAPPQPDGPMDHVPPGC